MLELIAASSNYISSSFIREKVKEETLAVSKKVLLLAQKKRPRGFLCVAVVLLCREVTLWISLQQMQLQVFPL